MQADLSPSLTGIGSAYEKVEEMCLCSDISDRSTENYFSTHLQCLTCAQVQIVGILPTRDDDSR